MPVVRARLSGWLRDVNPSEPCPPEPEPHGKEAVALAFLQCLLADRAAGRNADVTSYQARFPGTLAD